ncbi:MAG: hypothetical protein VYD77_02085 [Actinomycetota bacterium]|nr:hypothetical protein [Actinomycetota bacterium]MEE2682703.1 hypothetical protein [Actinomycetota bacterium]
MKLEASTFLLQWASGGMFFLWITTRQRMVALGYGWTTRTVYAAIATVSLIIGINLNTLWLREISTVLFLAAVLISMCVSIKRKNAGIAGQKEAAQKRAQRVAAMLKRTQENAENTPVSKEFPPLLDALAPAFGVIGLIAGSIEAGGPTWLSICRTLTGAAFLGAVSNSMLLGHWYLVQPGLSRQPIHTLINWTGLLWVPELVFLLIPTGMFSVLNGTIDDNYNGLLGWFWVACVIATIILVLVTKLALREKQYSAVMAATGLMYLAILTSFGMDLVARILLDY